MQYISTICAVEDAKFEVAIVTEAVVYVYPALAYIVTEYGKDLTDGEKLTRILEDCKEGTLNHNNLPNRNQQILQSLRICWQVSPERYDQKLYQFCATTDRATTTTDIYFIGMLPYGRAAAILQCSGYMSGSCGCEIACRFGHAMSALFAKHQGHSRNPGPTMRPSLFGAPHLCKIVFPPFYIHGPTENGHLGYQMIDARAPDAHSN